MAGARATDVRNGDRLILVGTMKGAFVFRGRGSGYALVGDGPHFPGQPVYSLAYDDRGPRPRLFAGTENPFFGSTLRRSDDLGRTWTEPTEPNVKFPADTDLALKQIWQIRSGRADEPDVLYCGVAPSALFESRDAGETWSLVRGLHDHPHRAQWTPGGGGLCLHTILPHPRDRARMLVASSTGGVYRTEDGGKTWQASNKGVRAEFLPDKHPEFGQCVHKVVHNPARPDRYFLQNHWGLYRSDDGGKTWQDIANGVPSDFGFAMAIHPHAADTVYIVPLQADTFRCTPEAKLRVYRTRDAGASWKPLTKGLPQKDAWETVLRDGLTTDVGDPAGIYFGTRSGKLFASRDDGNSWKQLADGLPPIVCVRAAVVREAAGRAPGRGGKTKKGSGEKTTQRNELKPKKRVAVRAPRAAGTRAR
jgi:photosystem II stability/assembly factor-like uncharacterized protein